MVPWTQRWAAFLDRPEAIPLLVLLVAIRFVAATITAFAGIEGMDTRGLDAAFELYSNALLVALLFLVGIGLDAWTPSFRRQRGFLLFLGLAAAVVVQWIGVVVPGLRLVTGAAAPWSDFLLGATAALALAVLASVLAARLAASGASPSGIDWYRSLGFGFAAALLLRSIRILDTNYLFGWELSPGLLWTLDFGPSLLLAALAIGAWSTLALPRVPRGRDRLLCVAVPFAFAATALAAALGVLGGFIASNALAWGGSYTVFAPTTVSLPIVGFGVGAFVATAWTLGRRLPRPAARLIFGGVAIAALAGIQTSAGTLASFAGLLAGIVCTARGLAELVTRTS